MDTKIQDLCDFLNQSHSVYHAAAGVARRLEAAGYTCLREQDAWSLEAGKKYYLVRGGTSVIAFRIPRGEPRGFLLSASHSDRPTFKVKENYEVCGNYTRMEVEKYGGMLMSTWMDRPLSIAGRVIVETQDGVESKLLDVDQDLLLIPNVAIHMNRQVNEGQKWNPAVDMLPLIGGKDAKGKLDALLQELAGGKILGKDLFLYVRQGASVWGLEDAYISSQALDDLECVWCCTQGFLNAGESDSIPVLCVFDAEEIGSISVQGAASTLLADVLNRIGRSLGVETERLLAQSFMVSADNAHAVHPNHPEMADPANAPVMGGGIVLKYNAAMSYCTDGASAALFKKVCAKAGAKTQIFYNRADIPGGSTLGRISLGKVSIPTVDVGLPQLAMHSSYETAATADAIAMEKAMTVYYSSTLEATDNGYTLK